MNGVELTNGYTQKQDFGIFWKSLTLWANPDSINITYKKKDSPLETITGYVAKMKEQGRWKNYNNNKNPTSLLRFLK